ncbi:LysE family translocator [Rheinheimera texasensis]|uniref:LysE family translocator n=1 Tax=Rheinheimera texasensis TaxID=306205 RepID=UPI0032B2489E
MSEQWLSFTVVALLTTLTPGPAVLFTLQNALSAGSKPALAGALGNATGLALVSLLAFAGVSLLLMQSALAFSVLKICGAAYLMYLAWGQWQQNGGSFPLNTAVVTSRGWFQRGVGVALTNPKAWLFISALFPQFISLQQPAAPQFAGLTLIFVCCSVLAHTFWLSLARFGMGSNPNPAVRRWLGRGQALLLALIGISLWWTPFPS